jgi:hypothetical protein
MEQLRSTLPSVARLTAQSLTSPSVKARTLDKSLPIQREPEEDGATNRMITRGKSTTDGHLEGASTVGLPVGTNRKCVILGASIIRLRLLHPRRIFFPKGMIPATTRVTSATAVKSFSSPTKEPGRREAEARRR